MLPSRLCEILLQSTNSGLKHTVRLQALYAIATSFFSLIPEKHRSNDTLVLSLQSFDVVVRAVSISPDRTKIAMVAIVCAVLIVD